MSAHVSRTPQRRGGSWRPLARRRPRRARCGRWSTSPARLVLAYVVWTVPGVRPSPAIDVARDGVLHGAGYVVVAVLAVAWAVQRSVDPPDAPVTPATWCLVAGDRPARARLRAHADVPQPGGPAPLPLGRRRRLGALQPGDHRRGGAAAARPGAPAADARGSRRAGGVAGAGGPGRRGPQRAGPDPRRGPRRRGRRSRHQHRLPDHRRGAARGPRRPRRRRSRTTGALRPARSSCRSSRSVVVDVAYFVLLSEGLWRPGTLLASLSLVSTAVLAVAVRTAPGARRTRRATPARGATGAHPAAGTRRAGDLRRRSPSSVSPSPASAGAPRS